MHATISFVKNHPVISGIFFAIFGVFMVYVSIDGAKRFRLYENAQELTAMSFVFLCLDGGEFKDAIMSTLERAGIAFIDVGMGVQERAGALTGLLRVTTSTPTVGPGITGSSPRSCGVFTTAGRSRGGSG